MALTKINDALQLSIPESNFLPIAGGQATGAIDFAAEVTVASATTCNIGAAASNYVLVSGTNSITAFDTVAAGVTRFVRFGGTLTLTYNATSMILPGGVSITTLTGDLAEFRSEGSGNWRCISYDRVDGSALLAVASDAFINQDIRGLSFMLADLKGDRLNMMDGIADPFNDLTDIDTTTSFGYVLSSNSLIPTAIQSISPTAPLSGGDAASHAASLAFDGNTSTYWASSQTSNHSGVSYIGYNLGSSKLVTSFTLTTYSSAGNSVTSVKVQYSSDGTTWSNTTGGTISTTTTASTTTTYSGFTGVSAQYWRLLANNNIGVGVSWQVPELYFNITNSSVLIQSNAFTSAISNPSTARLALQIDSSAVAFAINTDLLGYVSRDGGTTFTQVTLAITETLSNGSTIYDGTVNISAQPSGSSMIYRLTMPVITKSIPINGAIMQWRT